ncbi:putative cyclin-A3-1 [Aegilops tauschii subsp. strangulata]|nr:cyclin-A3-2-like isoform X1 [Triticum aestivum]
MEVSDEESVTGPARTPDPDSEPEQPDPAAAAAAVAPYPGDIDDETAADLARLLDSDSEQPDPAGLRSGMAPYLGDIDRYMRSLEASRRPRDDYMRTTQEDINPKMRAFLVDWLVYVALTFRLPADTLHLAVSYVDRFLTANVISQDKLQLLGVTALIVAAKYEDGIFVHEVRRYRNVAANTYTRQQVVKMESDILKSLNFEMGSPTARTFLRRYITVCRGRDRAKAKRLEFLCSYLAELSLLDYDCIKFNPSVVAAACLFLARFTISPTARPWNLTLQRNTKYKVSDLKSCILMIRKLQLNGTYPGLKGEAIKVKYNDREVRCAFPSFLAFACVLFF